jgi:hypothetical protein
VAGSLGVRGFFRGRGHAGIVTQVFDR